MRIKPALDTVKAFPLCTEVERVEIELRDDTWKALERKDWKEAARLADELVELARFKELICRR